MFNLFQPKRDCFRGGSAKLFDIDITSLLLCLLIVAVIVDSHALLQTRFSFAAEASKEKVNEVFQSHPFWRSLPPRFTDALSAKLISPDNAMEFIRLAENAEIKQNVIQIADQEPDFALGSVAITLTRYANSIGERRFSEAKRSLELALLLKPRDIPTWMAMALIAVNAKDCKTASAYADKVLTFQPNTENGDLWEASQAEVTKSGNVWNEMKAQMLDIKNLCEGRP
jgi:hypothetical protein